MPVRDVPEMSKKDQAQCTGFNRAEPTEAEGQKNAEKVDYVERVDLDSDEDIDSVAQANDPDEVEDECEDQDEDDSSGFDASGAEEDMLNDDLLDDHFKNQLNEELEKMKDGLKNWKDNGH